MSFFNFSQAFAQRSDVLKHWIEDTLSISHELTDFTANVLLDVWLAIVSVTAEEFKIALQLSHLLCQSITLHQSVRWGQLSSCDQISLEDFQVLAEPVDYAVGFLSLNLVFDPHGLDLLLLSLLVLVLATVIGISQLILVEFVLVSQSSNQLALFQG